MGLGLVRFEVYVSLIAPVNAFEFNLRADAKCIISVRREPSTAVSH